MLPGALVRLTPPPPLHRQNGQNAPLGRCRIGWPLGVVPLPLETGASDPEAGPARGSYRVRSDRPGLIGPDQI